MSATAIHALPRVSVHLFGMDRIADAVQDPSFLNLIAQGWRPVIVWAVEDDRGRGSLSSMLLVVLAAPLPNAPVRVTVAAPEASPTLVDHVLRFAQPVLLAVILLVLLLTHGLA